MNTREQKAHMTKHNIINSAEKLIKSRGIDNVSVDEIVKEAGVAKGSFYVYFKKKEDVLNSIGLCYFQKIYEEVINSSDSVDIKLEHYMQSFMKVIVDSGIELCRSWVKKVIYPQNNIESKLDFDLHAINDILTSCVNKKELNSSFPINEIGKMINTYLYGVMICWTMSNGNYDYQSEIKSYSNYLIKIIKKYQ